jgi:hypothetical protein
MGGGACGGPRRAAQGELYAPLRRRRGSLNM